MSGIESSFGTNQHRGGSRYKGMNQISPDIARKYNVKNVYDWKENTAAAAQYMRDNARDFTSRTGQQPQIGDFYGMHQQGPTGWTRIVNNPNGLAYKSVGFQQVLQNLPDNMRAQARSITNAQFRDFLNNKVSEIGRAHV